MGRPVSYERAVAWKYNYRCVKMKTHSKTFMLC
ncbi:hypothetical protein A2U01_0031460, partial [Trifolium medium]|nr:hypothetical protein [Trifolium medium]